MSDMSVASLLDRNRIAVVTGAFVVPLAACAALAGFRGSITNTTAALILVLLVVAAASTGVRVAGIVAAVSSGLWFDIFLTKPYGRVAITDRNDIEATVLLVVIGAAVTEVALWGFRQQARASRRSGYLDGVLGTAEIITLRKDVPQNLIDHVASQIAEVLDVDGCRYVPGPVRDARTPVLDHHGVVTREGRTLNVDRNGLPSNDEIALLVRRGDTTLGHFLLNAAARIARPSLEQRRVAVLLADQVAGVVQSQSE
jgi:K+-sensing histidine kinase KdpD